MRLIGALAVLLVVGLAASSWTQGEAWAPALPGDADAAYGGRQVRTPRAAAADPVRWALATFTAETGDLSDSEVEALLMALAGPLGRDTAHELVGKLSREAVATGVAFSELVTRDPVVTANLAKEDLTRALDLQNQVGLATMFVDRVLTRHRGA